MANDHVLTEKHWLVICFHGQSMNPETSRAAVCGWTDNEVDFLKIVNRHIEGWGSDHIPCILVTPFNTEFSIELLGETAGGVIEITSEELGALPNLYRPEMIQPSSSA